jgi:hypothetical protein
MRPPGDLVQDGESLASSAEREQYRLEEHPARLLDIPV